MTRITQNWQKSFTLVVVPYQRMQLKEGNGSMEGNGSNKDSDNNNSNNSDKDKDISNNDIDCQWVII